MEIMGFERTDFSTALRMAFSPSPSVGMGGLPFEAMMVGKYRRVWLVGLRRTEMWVAVEAEHEVLCVSEEEKKCKGRSVKMR